MFVGTKDKMATLLDNRGAYKQMGEGIVKYYKEYPLGHLAFLTAKDMSYFTIDALAVLQQYHPTQISEQTLIQKSQSFPQNAEDETVTPYSSSFLNGN